MTDTSAKAHPDPESVPEVPGEPLAPPSGVEPFAGQAPPCRFQLDPRWLAILPALAAILLYLPALNYQFVWDDTIFLRDMPAYRDPNLWLSSLFRPFVLSPNYFRPLAMLTFVGELSLGGLNPLIFHLTNLLLHAINAALVTLLALHVARSMVKDGPSAPRLINIQVSTLLAILAGLLYAFHPALIEGVAFVSSRFDLLMTTCLLLALLVDLTVQDRWARPVLVGLLFLLAALSKEMALAFAFALPFWHLAVHHSEHRAETLPEQKETLGGAKSRLTAGLRSITLNLQNSNWPVYLAVLIAGLGYLGIRYAALKYLLVLNSQAVLPVGDLLQHGLLFLKSLAVYGILVLWPFTSLNPIHYSSLPVPAADPSAWLALVLDVLLVVGMVMLIRRRPRSGWLALGGLLALLPVLNLAPLELGGGAFAAERFLLFPMVFFILAAVNLAAEFQWSALSFQRLVLPVSLLWLVASVAAVQLTLPNWQDNMSLWTWAMRLASHSATPPTNLALEYNNRGQYQIALNFAQQANSLDPKNGDAWDNGGLALFYLGRYAEAQSAFQQAVTLQPDNALYWNNLAGALREQGQLADAEKMLLDKALTLDPNLPAAYLNLGIVYLDADRPDLASQKLQIALQLFPPDQTAEVQSWLDKAKELDRWMRLGDLLMKNGDYQGAARAYNQAAVFGASMADTGDKLSTALIALKDWNNATKVLQQAIQAAPQDARLYYDLGIVAREQGNNDSARQWFGKAIELNPTWDLPKQALADLPK